MNETISIIIPVYKVEAYLPKCIESILRQTYRDLEIILVDDGSPDRCGEICDQYAGKDERIRVIHKENGGVARARNDGIECATGAYISFIDSDDWIAENAYEILYQGLKQYGADCAVGRCVTVYDRDGVLKPRENKASAVKCETSDEAMRHVLLNGSAVWNRLFKREVFREIRFPVGRVNDDEVVALHAYGECGRIVFLNQDTYYYRIRQNSITTSKFSLRNVDCYYNSVDNLEFIREKKPQLEECADYKRIRAMLYCYIHLRRLKGDPKAREIRGMLREELRKSRKSALKNRYLSPAMKALFAVCSL